MLPKNCLLTLMLAWFLAGAFPTSAPANEMPKVVETKPSEIEVVIERKGKLLVAIVQGKEVDPQKLGEHLKSTMDKKSLEQLTVKIRANREISYGELVKAMDSLHSVGIKRIQLDLLKN